MKDGITYESLGDTKVLAIAPDTLDAINLHIVPELKQFVTLDKQGRLLVPASMKIGVQRHGHGEHTEYHMILGHDSLGYHPESKDNSRDEKEQPTGNDAFHIEQIKDLSAFENHKGNPADYEEELFNEIKTLDVTTKEYVESALSGLSVP